MKNTILTTLCYVKKGGKTLMLHKNKKPGDVHQGKWNGLGGKFFPGETPEECAKREVWEESGLTIRNPILRGVLTYPMFLHGSDEYVFIFTATKFSGRLIDSPEGDLKWVQDSRLMELSLWEGDPLFWEWMKDGRFFSGKMVYRGERLLRHEVTFYGTRRRA
ncbi:MAG: 8-oxo-dGTP diphosphatase [Candidatus Omnitrophica bacterium]|nr:8-oxo-dGTP diphosphatase [Candidatus Omnitrophota bacterium]